MPCKSAFRPSQSREKIMGFSCKYKRLKTRNIDLKLLYSSCLCYPRDKIALYSRINGTYCRQAVKPIEGDDGFADTAGCSNPSPHPNLQCTAGKKDWLHIPSNGGENRKYSWEGQGARVCKYQWPEHTFIRDQSEQPAMCRDRDDASARTKAWARKGWSPEHTFIREKSSHILIFRNWNGAHNQGPGNKSPQAAKARAYLYLGHIHLYYYVLLLWWSSHARAQAYFHLEPIHIIFLVHLYESSTERSQIEHAFIREHSTDPSGQSNLGEAYRRGQRVRA